VVQDVCGQTSRPGACVSAKHLLTSLCTTSRLSYTSSNFTCIKPEHICWQAVDVGRLRTSSSLLVDVSYCRAKSCMFSLMVTARYDCLFQACQGIAALHSPLALLQPCSNAWVVHSPLALSCYECIVPFLSFLLKASVLPVSQTENRCCLVRDEHFS